MIALRTRACRSLIALIGLVALAVTLASTSAGADPPPAGTLVSTSAMPTPRDVQSGFGSVWVANGPNRTVTRIDPGTGDTIASIAVGVPASVLAAGAGSMWLTSVPANTLLRIDPATNLVTGSVSLAPSGTAPIGVTVYAGFVWVANHDGTPTTSVSKIDPSTMAIVDTIPVGSSTIAGPTKVVGAGGSIWVDVPSIPGVVRIDPGSDSIIATIANKGSCADLTGDGTAIWVADGGGPGCTGGYPGISRIDPATNRVAALLNAGGQTVAVALAASTLWYGTVTSNFLGRLDTTSNSVTGLLKLPGPAFALTTAGGSVWITDREDGLLFRVRPT